MLVFREEKVASMYKAHVTGLATGALQQRRGLLRVNITLLCKVGRSSYISMKISILRDHVEPNLNPSYAVWLLVFRNLSPKTKLRPCITHSTKWTLARITIQLSSYHGFTGPGVPSI